VTDCSSGSNSFECQPDSQVTILLSARWSILLVNKTSMKQLTPILSVTNKPHMSHVKCSTICGVTPVWKVLQTCLLILCHAQLENHLRSGLLYLLVNCLHSTRFTCTSVIMKTNSIIMAPHSRIKKISYLGSIKLQLKRDLVIRLARLHTLQRDTLMNDA